MGVAGCYRVLQGVADNQSSTQKTPNMCFRLHDCQRSCDETYDYVLT